MVFLTASLYRSDNQLVVNPPGDGGLHWQEWRDRGCQNFYHFPIKAAVEYVRQDMPDFDMVCADQNFCANTFAGLGLFAHRRCSRFLSRRVPRQRKIGCVRSLLQ